MAKLERKANYITEFLESRGQKPQHPEPHGTSLYHMRDAELRPDLAAKLWPFVCSYRPDMSYDDAVARREEIEKVCERVKSGSFTDDVRELYWEIKGYYPEENPELVEAS